MVQDVGIGRYTLPPHTTKTRTTTNWKSKKQPELPEYWTIWKSDNHHLEEETFIQIGRRSRDRQPRWRGHTPRWNLDDQVGEQQLVIPLCMWINQEEQLGNKTDCATQDSSLGKASFKTYVCKNMWGFQGREKLLASQESSSERPTGS